MKRRVCVLLWLFAACALAGQGVLQDGDFVGICGDSITEQKQYSVFIESYLLMCQPVKVRVMQFGWGGETAPGFLHKMSNDAVPFKLSVATTCYGMNDGGYRPFDPSQQGKRYTDGMKGILDTFKKAGTRVVVVGSPGCVDSQTFRRDPKAAAMYNVTLAKLRDIAQATAKDYGMPFANVYDVMLATMAKAKAKYGVNYHVAGGDGVHPSANGQLVMAYAFLKALGCDGDIGTITVDLAGNSAQATDGHTIVAVKGGAVEVESTRYPFCFFGNPKDVNATSGIIEFFPFNDDLNRLTLIVKGGGNGSLKVTWGKTSKTFPAAQLAKGVNLAAEFLDNPFCAPFTTVQNAIRQQQAYETPLIKELINKLPRFQSMVPEEAEALGRIRTAAAQKGKALFDAAAAAVKPVKHTIRIEGN